MDSVLRALVIYVVLLAMLRATGKRTLDQVTTFDFVLLLIIGEATQQALLGDDFSLTNALVVISTLLVVDMAFSYVKQWSPKLDRVVEGVPTVVVEEGRILHDRMKRLRVDESDILEAGRMAHGIERMEHIKYAVVERSGGISVVPYPASPGGT